jgi:TRAP-type C4-dicarboxylate transport system permease small subunit
MTDEAVPSAALLTAAEGEHPGQGVNTPPSLSGWPLRIWNGALGLQRLILLACGVLLTLLIAVQVVTRYLMGISIFGIEELASFVAVYLYFIGGAHGAWERGHISASLIELVLPEGRPRLAAQLLASLITVIVSGWMTVWAFQYLAFVIRRGTMSLEVGIPMSVVVVVIPLGLALMTLYFVAELAERVRALRDGAP